MSWESIGSVNTGELPEDETWIEFCQKLAIQYIKLVCGEPPAGAALGIMSQDHELGSYTTIGVYSDYSMPFDYVSACENALEVFDSAVSWEDLKELYAAQFSQEDDKDQNEDYDETD
jgi:hypothetical protein